MVQLHPHTLILLRLLRFLGSSGDLHDFRQLGNQEHFFWRVGPRSTTIRGGYARNEEMWTNKVIVDMYIYIQIQQLNTIQVYSIHIYGIHI